MDVFEIKGKLENSLIEADVESFKNALELLNLHASIDEGAEIIAYIIDENYSRLKSDYLAKLLELAIRKNPAWALINLSENWIFKIAIGVGSVDLYECYMEEAVEPVIKKKDFDSRMSFILDLFSTAEKIDEDLLTDYPELIQGTHYNGGFIVKESGSVQLNTEDYQIMKEIISNYTAIIGRRKILKDLSKRIDDCAIM